MKKSIYYGAALSLGFASLFSANTFATGNHFIFTEDDLRTCLTEVTDYNTCSVQKDIALKGSITIPDGALDAYLNLMGHTISADSANFAGSKNTGLIIVNHGAQLTVKGTGKITTQDIKDTEDTTDDVDSGIYAAIAMTATGDTNDTEAAKLIVDSDATLEGKYYGIVGNGSEGRGNTDITISSGTIRGLTENDSVGIYHPQDGILNITGGTIEGNNGLYIKSGTVNIEDGTISGIGAPHAYEFNGSAAITTGDAIVLENAEYPGGAPVLNITGGTFTSENNKSLALYVKTEGTTPLPTATITGGAFQEAPAADEIPSGYAVFEEGEEGHKTYTVKKLADLSALDTLLNTIENDDEFYYDESYGDDDLPTKIADSLRQAKIIVTSKGTYDESKQPDIDALRDDLEDAYNTQKANNAAIDQDVVAVFVKYLDFLNDETPYTEESLARVNAAFEALADLLEVLAEKDLSAEDFSEEMISKSKALSDAIDTLEERQEEPEEPEEETEAPDTGSFTGSTSVRFSATALVVSGLIVTFAIILPRLISKKNH